MYPSHTFTFNDCNPASTPLTRLMPVTLSWSDARGFLIGSPIAPRLSASFIPIRKRGKLPGPCLSIPYTKEYGPDRMEVQAAALRRGARVVVVDDLLASGGTLGGAVGLCEQAGAVVLECVVLVELCELNGRTKVGAAVHSFIEF